MRIQRRNHSCQPRTVFKADALSLLALEDIREAEKLTFFYPSTEWDMSTPFEGHCGGAECIGTVRGAKFLPLETLRRHQINPHLAQIAGVYGHLVNRFPGDKEGPVSTSDTAPAPVGDTSPCVPNRFPYP